MEHAEQEPASVGVDREPSPDAAESPWLALLKPARVKMELAAPVYGHGFGPPPVALDLSRPPALDAVAYVRQTTPPFTPVAGEIPLTEGLKIKRESSIKDEPASSSPGADGTAAVPGAVSERRPDNEPDGCSRTAARFSETWLAKWQRRRELLVSKRQTEPQQPDQRVLVVSPGVTSPQQEASARKALVRPHRKHASEASDPIPVGIAVARQRPEKALKQPASPHEPPDLCPSAVPADLFQTASASIPSAYAPPFSPYPAANWPLWPVPEYAGHPFWPGRAPPDAMGFPGYSSPGVIHHRHVPSPSAGTPSAPPTQPPLLLIPCVDPYRQTAMFWTPGYHHGVPLGAPWSADLVHHPTPAPTPWPVVPHHRPFDVHPGLSAAFVDNDASTDHVKPAESCLGRVEASAEPPVDEIKRERATPEADDAPPAQTIRVRDNLIEPGETDAAYSGLQLLSDSIERFVCRADSPPAGGRRASADVPGGNALDVLCAAALLGEPADPSPPTPLSPPAVPGGQSTSACVDSPKELDFRSKLAEIQRMYKEKQQILKHLKPKRKEKGEKKKKKSDGKKRHSSQRRRDSGGSGPADEHRRLDAERNPDDNDAACPAMRDGQSVGECRPALSDLIIPGRLELASSARRPRGGEDAGGVAPKIPASYAAALASAAATVTSTQPGPASGPPEKKKRKPECPVRKHDTEPTETIVPCKKRKFIQLFRWCHSASSPPADDGDGDGTETSRSPSKQHQKPKIKPKLKAELQVKQRERQSDDSGRESNGEEEPTDEAGGPIEIDHNERLERHCLPALQLLQLRDDEDERTDTKPVEPDETVAEGPVEPVQTEDTHGNALEPAEERDAIASDGGGDAWTLRQEALGDGLRVLIAEDGLLLAGTVTGICPPDIYGVAVDGERGCRPRILSTEELLRLAVMEVRPLGLHELAVGTRVCAYWSRKSRTLYPGVVSSVHHAPPASGHQRSQASREDEIDVEFDDGDSGRMPISLIRLLPPDYPVTERDPNPLLTLESRRTKRRASEPTTPLAPTTSSVALIPAASNGEVKGETKDGTKTSKKTKRDESKENNDNDSKNGKSSKSGKKHKKKRKRRRASESVADDQLIIPVSPGLAVEHAADDDEAKPRRAVNSSIAADDAPGDRLRGQQRAKASQSLPAKSKIAAFLPERQLWEWLGPSCKKASKGKGRKEFYKAIHRGDEVIRVGDCAIFLSAGRQDRPYVGRIELLWQSWGGSMTVKVRWFYHPEETCGGHRLVNLKTPGALFESNHIDENDVQTISHCCTVCSIEEYRGLCRGKRDVNLNLDAGVGVGYDHFYLAGFYDPTSGHLSFEPGVLDTPDQHQVSS